MRSGPARAERATVVVIGLGNIGSHVVPHLARMPAIRRLVLIDPDAYDASNRASQAITSAAMNKIKVAVQRDVVGGINPELHVDAWHASVEDVPLGHLRSDVIVACLDSRAARQDVNEIARLLGTPWIDAGVEPDGWLARVNVYAPHVEAPCLECAWDQRDYDLLAQRYPCKAKDVNPSTRAASSLGALAASLQATECQKLLTGRPAKAAVGCQVLIDAKAHVLLRTVLPHNKRCRLPHVAPVEVSHIDARVDELTVAETCARAGIGSRPPLRLHVPMSAWARRRVCSTCGYVATGPTLCRRAGDSRLACPCGAGDLHVSGFDREDQLCVDRLGSVSERTLAELGLRDGEVIGIERAAEVRYVAVGARHGATGAGR